MRVLQITGAYPVPPEGGLEVAVTSLSRELSRLGVAVHLVGASGDFQETSQDGVRILGLRATRLTNWIRVPSLRAIRVLKRELDWAEIVHVHNPQELFNLVAAGMALSRDKPLCLSLLSPGTLWRHPRGAYRALGAFADGLVRQLVRRASFVQVKNKLDLEFALPLNHNTKLIPDGIPREVLDAPRSGEAGKTRFRLGESYPVFLFLGRLHPLKGPDHLVRVLRELSGRFPSAVAVIVGSDSMGMSSRLSALAKDLGVGGRVRIAGRLSEPDKIEAIDAADLVVIPSLADHVEGFSIVASEAWARGKPVAGYSSGALKVRVVEGRNGALASAETVPDLAAAVVRALEIRQISLGDDVVPWSQVARQILDAYRGLEGAGVGRSRPSSETPLEPAMTRP